MKKFSPVAAVFRENSSDLSEKPWRFSDSYGFVTTFNRFFGEYSVLLCYDYIAERKSANKFKGALAMKNKRTILSTILALVLAMSFIIASAAVISANDNKSSEPQKKICVAAGETSDSCGTQSFENFVKGLTSLTEQEKATLIADLEQIETLEKKIDEIYARMTDENADSLYDEINAVDSKLSAVLERNAKLWERVNDEYDEKIAAKEPDMTLDPAEEDFNGHCTEKEETYEESIKGMTSLTEQEKAALLADLVILDIMMPGTDGLTCCRIIREKDKVPIVLLTAKDTEYDYVNGILQGGDDYLTKPFRPTVLLMRVKALLRRVEMERGGNPMDRDVTVGDLRFSGAEKQLFCKGKIVSLSPNEMKMLLFLMHNEGKALSRDELLNQIWGYNDEVETRVTDETLRRIRSKLSAADSDILIETVWGYGYRLRLKGDGV